MSQDKKSTLSITVKNVLTHIATDLNKLKSVEKTDFLKPGDVNPSQLSKKVVRAIAFSRCPLSFNQETKRVFTKQYTGAQLLLEKFKVTNMSDKLEKAFD